MSKPAISRTAMYTYIFIIFVIIMLFIIWFVTRNAPKNEAEPVSETTRNTVFSGDGIPTSTIPPIFNVTPSVTAVPTIPAPLAGYVLDSSDYLGGYIGDLISDMGVTFKVYAPAYDTMNTLLIPKEGFVLWQGHFIGHLLQPGWVPLNIGNSFTWTPTHGNSVFLRVNSLYKSVGFNNTLNALQPNNYDLVTCYEDPQLSTPQNRVFAGNVIYFMNME